MHKSLSIENFKPGLYYTTDPNSYGIFPTFDEVVDIMNNGNHPVISLENSVPIFIMEVGSIRGTKMHKTFTISSSEYVAARILTKHVCGWIILEIRQFFIKD